jgi:branched-subunit amino acid transport protein
MAPVILAAVALTIAGCYLFKVLGFLVPEGLMRRRPVADAVRILPVALLASLIVSQTLGGGGGITIDARLLGLAVAGVLLAVRAPLALTLVAAVGATALLRLAIGL